MADRSPPRRRGSTANNYATRRSAPSATDAVSTDSNLSWILATIPENCYSTQQDQQGQVLNPSGEITLEDVGVSSVSVEQLVEHLGDPYRDFWSAPLATASRHGFAFQNEYLNSVPFAGTGCPPFNGGTPSQMDWSIANAFGTSTNCSAGSAATCDICQARFGNKREKRRHLKTVHGDEKYVCKCGHETGRLDNYRGRHLRTCAMKHDPDRLFMCICGDLSSSLSYHLDHISNCGKKRPGRGSTSSRTSH